MSEPAATASPCTHPRLVHVVNIEAGGDQSTTYRCEQCRALLTVAIKPLRITVRSGRPEESK